MNPGKLDKRITIQKYGETQDDDGFDIKDWVDYKTIWASVNNLWGREFYAAKAVNAESTVEFVVRYSKALEVLFQKDGTKLYRIYWDNRVFNITFVDNIQYKNSFIKIKAIESN